MKTEVPKTAVVKYEALKDHVLIKGIDKGEVVVAENLLSKDKGGLEVLLPQGKHTVAIRTTAEKVAGGFVLPGSRVNVFHTVRHGDKESESRVILQNILVRAVDQQAMKPEDKPGLVPATVTLEVTPQQALAHGQGPGCGLDYLGPAPVWGRSRGECGLRASATSAAAARAEESRSRNPQTGRGKEYARYPERLPVDSGDIHDPKRRNQHDD